MSMMFIIYETWIDLRKLHFFTRSYARSLTVFCFSKGEVQSRTGAEKITRNWTSPKDSTLRVDKEIVIGTIGLLLIRYMQNITDNIISVTL